METLKLEQWPLARLRPYERGLRKYGKDVVERMMAAIREYGFRVPVLARSDGEVVDGRLRLDAATHLGLATIPVIPADGLTEAQVRAFRLLVNRSNAWAAWDEEMVAVELGELRDLDVDLALTGFDVSELDELLGLLPLSGHTDPDDVPDLPETPITRPGDIWLLGRHRLLCGDATGPADLAALLGDERPDLVVTDPPYNVAVEGKAGRILNDDMAGAAFREFLGRAWDRSEWAIGHDGKARRIPSPESGIRLLAHGVSGRVAQISGFGDAVVPYVAYEIGRAIMAAHYGVDA